MRIIAGKHRSRKLNTLEGMQTRPMMDRMKESIFQQIGPYFPDMVVLDLFGGSGALALEAISRNAKHAYICEINKDAQKVIQENIALLQEENVTLMKVDYQEGLKRLRNQKVSFDVVFLDPPFQYRIFEEILEDMSNSKLLKNNAMVVLQYSKGTYDPKEEYGYTIYKQNSYGKNEVTIFEYHLPSL